MNTITHDSDSDMSTKHVQSPVKLQRRLTFVDIKPMANEDMIVDIIHATKNLDINLDSSVSTPCVMTNSKAKNS
jgi:hypothetical protein